MKDVIKHILTEAIKKIYADDKLLDLIEVQNVTAKNIKADFFSNISMKLAKKLRIKPLVIADEIVKNCTTTEDIKKICLVNYGVGFVTSSPLNVKGDEAHEIFVWLNKEYGKFPKWNFYKYLFNKKGDLDSWYASTTKPNSEKLIKAIDKVLLEK